MHYNYTVHINGQYQNNLVGTLTINYNHEKTSDN